MGDTRHEAPEISIVVPVVQGGSDPRLLYSAFSPVAKKLARPFEFVFVVDEKECEVLSDLQQMFGRSPGEVILVVLSMAVGESAALAAGISRAAGATIVTLAPHIQVEPDALGEVVAAFDNGDVDMIVARRFPRSDGLLPRLQSSLFHWLIRALTGTKFRDISCGLRVMTRELATSLDLYGDLHRFIPLLAHRRGFVVKEVKVSHHPFDRPTGLYGPAAYARRLLDTLTMFFLVRFTRRPLRFFGLIGAPTLLMGSLITLYLGIYRLRGLGSIADRPLLVVGVLLLVMGVQSLSIGLLGELIIFSHGRDSPEYRIAEVIEKTPVSPFAKEEIESEG